MTKFTHARFHKGGYEVSSRGDRRFSALNARLADGRSVEEAYQLDIKGYRKFGNHWLLGKGKPSLNGHTHEQLWDAYKALWVQWAKENPLLMAYLRAGVLGSKAVENYVLTDMYANGPVSQARALAEILNESEG